MKKDYIIVSGIIIFTIIMMIASVVLNFDKTNTIKIDDKEYIINNELKLNDFIGKGKPVLVDIGSVDCGACKELLPTIYKLQDKYESKAIIMFIDYLKHRELAMNFDFVITPTLYFYDPEGNLFKKLEGVVTEEEIKNAFIEMGYPLDW